MPDPQEGAASCLPGARRGSLPVPIRELHSEFAVEWQADYRIEGRAFIVILGYAVEEIDKMVPAPATESSLVAAHERMKIGRNEPCPCGSGHKYKKCCLRADEDLVRQTAIASQVRRDVSAQEMAAAPDSDGVARPRKVKEISETDRRLDELWQWFDSLNPPSTEQMDELLEKLLALPDATEWNDVLHTCAQKGHPDLPAVFRRIAAVVPHTRETGMSYFYWAAAEEFTRRGFGALLPEVVAGYAKLGADGYDADALVHIEDILLGGRFEAEALGLAERFLPIIRADDSLMPYAAIEKCNLVFQLRAGIALRGEQDGASSPQAVVEVLGRDLEEDIEDDAIDRAAQVACDTFDPVWARAHFDLVTGDIRESEQAWQDCLRLYDALLRVSREAWRIDGLPSGWVFVGLSRLLESVYRAQNRDEPKRKKNRKGRTESQTDNLLDCLTPSGMEQRIALACPDLLGVNVARAQILVDAHTVLLDFAGRHGLIADGTAAATRTEVARLRGVLASG